MVIFIFIKKKNFFIDDVNALDIDIYYDISCETLS